MKVILTQDVRGQGKRGQMIEVSDGYARNFLLPRKLAQEATADNINTMRMNDKATQERQAKERAEALELRNRMKDMTVVVTAKGGGAGRLFGSVTNTEVSEALAKQAGVQLDKRKIVLDEPIKSVGVYTVKCRTQNRGQGSLSAPDHHFQEGCEHLWMRNCFSGRPRRHWRRSSPCSARC